MKHLGESIQAIIGGGGGYLKTQRARQTISPLVAPSIEFGGHHCGWFVCCSKAGLASERMIDRLNKSCAQELTR